MSDLADVMPLTVLIPETAAQPIEVYDQHAALRMAVVERSGARIGQHLKSKAKWTRAVLIRRDTTFGFNSAQVGWLEGRLYDLMASADDAVLDNKNRPSDETLPPYDRLMLEAVVLPVSRLLRLIGHDPATADDTPALSANRTSRFYGITVGQLTAAGLIDGNATLVSTNGTWPASGRVLDDGQIETGGKTYPTPSAAASAVKGGAANGWDFWAVETTTGNTTLATLRARYLETKK